MHGACNRHSKLILPFNDLPCTQQNTRRNFRRA